MKIIFSSIVFVIISTSLLFAGDLKGRVTFKGTAPAPQQIEITKDTKFCGTMKTVQDVAVDPEGGLKDVLVRIVGIRSSTPYSGPELLLTQKNCEFVPSVVAVPVGVSLTITSDDPVLHNVHGFREDESTAFNYAVPIRGMKLYWKKTTTPGIVKVKCDAGHTWMAAWVIVTENPYFAVTDVNGSFTISSIPAGSYQVEAWHSTLGKQTQTIEVASTEGTVLFQFTGK